MIDRLQALWNENRSFIIFMVLMVCFRSAIADWNEVPTGSMKPTILEGDRILVNKIAYDIRLPFVKSPLITLADPVRGDIVVFDSTISDKRLVKRVVGVAGDTVKLENNRLYINGVKLDYIDIAKSAYTTDRTEKLFGVDHQIRIRHYRNHAADFPEVVVPDGYYLVLGDNRDNSGDSRVIGFVPRTEIIGRTRNVIVSLDYENNHLPRHGRYFRALDDSQSLTN